MKIQCDVCEKAPAAVICCADEAALCPSCDVEVHAANKLASKHQRLRLECLPNGLPRCDICQEKAAFIFCVEDRALFCRDCDEPVHVAGTLSGNHQRYLATGIRVAASMMCNKDLKDNTEPPHHGPALIATKVPATQQSTPSFMHSAWAVDEFLQLSDQETGEKESPVGFGELEWFADIGLFHDETPTKDAQAAAQVPELLIRGAGGRWMCSAPELDLHLELALDDNIASCLLCYSSSAEGFVASSDEPIAFRATAHAHMYRNDLIIRGDSDDTFVFDEG